MCSERRIGAINRVSDLFDETTNGGTNLVAEKRSEAQDYGRDQDVLKHRHSAVATSHEAGLNVDKSLHLEFPCLVVGGKCPCLCDNSNRVSVRPVVKSGPDIYLNVPIPHFKCAERGPFGTVLTMETGRFLVFDLSQVRIAISGGMAAVRDMAGNIIHMAEVNSARFDVAAFELLSDAIRYGTAVRDGETFPLGFYDPLSALTEVWERGRVVRVGIVSLAPNGSVLDVNSIGRVETQAAAASRGFSAHSTV